MRRAPALICVCLSLAAVQRAPAQRDVAAFDPTGLWVAVVTEDWKYRMVAPAKGVYDGIPLNAAGRQLADIWEPAAQGADCRNYGAASLLRVPGRLRIDWADADTLRIASDAGGQTRLLRFAAPPAGATPSSSRQGLSIAVWRYAPGQSPRDGASVAGDLEVVTTGLAPGFLRPNGVPHGAEATVTEYFNLHGAPNGDDWLVVTIVVEDPQYLSRPYVTSAHFKRLASDAGWHPTPCTEP